MRAKLRDGTAYEIAEESGVIAADRMDEIGLHNAVLCGRTEIPQD